MALYYLTKEYDNFNFFFSPRDKYEWMIIKLKNKYWTNMRLGIGIEVLELYLRLLNNWFHSPNPRLMRNYQTSNKQDSGATEA